MDYRLEIDRISKKLVMRFYKDKDSDRYKLIYEISKSYGIDPLIIISIFLIETHYRPVYLRILEYFVFALSFVRNLMFKHKINNYTLGVFQIGLTITMSFGGICTHKIHDRSINQLSIKEFIKLIRLYSFNNSLRILCHYIQYLLHSIEKEWGESKTNIGRLGELYNGDMIYGLLFLNTYDQIYYLTKNNCTTNFLL